MTDQYPNDDRRVEHFVYTRGPLEGQSIETEGSPPQRATRYATPAEVQHAVELEPVLEVPTVRDDSSVSIANMGKDGSPHFLVHKDGQELCGSCGQPFPCTAWREEIAPRNEAASSGQVADSMEFQRKVENLSGLLGVSLERAREIVRDSVGGP